MKHNGWTNRFTWAVNLWLTNDEALNARASALATEAQSVDELADQLMELVREDVFNPDKPASLADDLLGTVIDEEVNWDEIARAWMER